MSLLNRTQTSENVVCIKYKGIKEQVVAEW